MIKPYLFTLTDTEKKDLFTVGASSTGLPSYVLEKDYYVTLVLKLLFEKLKPQHTGVSSTPFMFKGGTTLSKVFRCINRMSEDIDLSLDMKFLGHPEPEVEESNNACKKRVDELNKAASESVAATLAPFLRKELGQIHSDFSVRVMPNGLDIEIFYPQLFQAPAGGYIRPRVLLECGGKAGLEPSDTHTVTPMVLEDLRVQHDDSCTVDVLGCDRTFFEKLTALHEINHRGVASLGERQSRHIYDVIAIHEQNPDFIENQELLAKVVGHKQKYFKRATAKWDEAVPGSLKIMPEGEIAEALEADWEKMGVMFPGDLPWSFADMMQRLKAISDQVNGPKASGEDIEPKSI